VFLRSSQISKLAKIRLMLRIASSDHPILHCLSGILYILVHINPSLLAIFPFSRNLSDAVI
jgi:hypothetical protein